MTTNRRYPDKADGRADELRIERARQGEPVSLTTAEWRRTGRRTDPAEPVPVTAVIRHRFSWEEPLPVEGLAVAWTRGAVLVKHVDPYTQQDRFTWVYAAAVSSRRS